MGLRIPEPHKKPGLCYAETDDGLELPVIDITQPAFASAYTAADLEAISAASLEAMRAAIEMPIEVRRALAAGSVLTRDAGAPFLGGLTTYLQKLGPGNLGAGYATDMDRRVAQGIGPVSMRIRLAEVSRLLAEGLTTSLADHPGRAVHLVNIGGGVAPDSLNALILLRTRHPDPLQGRPVRIHVLDVDREGPSFGARALAALASPGGPLAGCDLILESTVFDWNDVTALEALLSRIDPGSVVAAFSSEGALFEYGTDEAIVANLGTIAAWSRSAAPMVGSVLRDEATVDPCIPLLATTSRMTIRLLGLGRLEALAARAGWRVDHVLEGTRIYHSVRLTPA